MMMVAVLASGLPAAYLCAQKLPLFQHQQWYGIDDGLPQSFVTGIVQDEHGFIWVGTPDGVARFDGKSFKSYKYNPSDPFSLGTNSTSRLVKNKQGELYIDALETSKAYRLDASKERFYSLSRMQWFDSLYHSIPFINYSGPVWSFYRVHQRVGVGFVDTASGRSVFFGAPYWLNKEDTVMAPPLQLQDRSWIFASSLAIFELDKHLKKLVRFALPRPVLFSHRNGAQLTSFLEMQDGRIIIPSAEGLLFWSRETNQYGEVPYKKPSQGEQARFLQIGPNGSYYFALNDEVYRLEANGNQTLLWKNTQVPGRRITAMLIDRTGVLWAGIDAAGMARINLLSMPFEATRSDSLFHGQVLWRLGYSPQQMPSHLSREDGSYAFRSVYDTVSKGYFLAYTISATNHRPLHYYVDGMLTLLRTPPQEIYLRVGALASGRGGRIWAYNIMDMSIYHWDSVSQMGVRHAIKARNVPPMHAAPYDMLEIGDELWISTNGMGLVKLKNFEITTWLKPESKPLALPNNLTDMAKDPADTNAVWIGSLGSGLFRLHAKTGKLENFTTKEGLPNNTIYCIETDVQGMLWMSTNKGIFRFDPITKVVQSFDKSDGLPGNEFNRSHVFRFANGQLAFGGTDGAVFFYPADLKPPLQVPADILQITGIEINGEEQGAGAANSLVPTSFPQLSSLRLPYNKNFITVHFSSLLYNDPQKTRYRYRLKGIEENWNNALGNTGARYTQLQPGAYTLQLNATGPDGQFSNQVRELQLVINPPWWKSWVAYLLYTAVLGYAAYRYRKFRQKRREERRNLRREHEEAERLRALDQVKEKFFGNVTHELRTPITLITAPLEQLALDAELSYTARKHVDTARQNSERLLRLVNDILDVNKLEAGHLKLAEHVGEFHLFIAQCVQRFEASAAAKGIALSLRISSNVNGYYSFDQQKLETILFNLLSNALKFTPSGGQVHVAADASEKQGQPGILLSIKDSGIGMSASALENIFNRFYQTGDQGLNYGGTGIGLSLVKELVQLMQGSIDVNSTSGHGTQFAIYLPLQKIHAESQATSTAEAVAEQTKAPAMPPTEPKGPLEAGRPVVLVAEDNEELRHYIQVALEPLFDVHVTRDGAEAWACVVDLMPDLVVSDMMMPVMDGSELAARMKADKRVAHIPFLLLTSRASNEAKVYGLSQGADDYLTKPFHMPELQLRLSNLLQQRARLYAHWQQQMQLQVPAIPAATDAFVAELYQMLEERLDDPQLGVEALCKSFGMSASSLNRKLKATLDTSANDLIRNYRLKKAAALIRAGHDISRAAYACGFSSPSYFSQRFKEFFGTTPSEYASTT